MCIVGVIAGGHYDQGRDFECKVYYYFLYSSVLPASLTCLMHINTDVDVSDCHYDRDLLMMVMLLLLLSLLNVFSPLKGS